MLLSLIVLRRFLGLCSTRGVFVAGGGPGAATGGRQLRLRDGDIRVSQHLPGTVPYTIFNIICSLLLFFRRDLLTHMKSFNVVMWNRTGFENRGYFTFSNKHGKIMSNFLFVVRMLLAMAKLIIMC